MPSSFRQRDLSSSPPTIEQIAMGLHLSRTPHLRPAGGQYHSPYGRTSAQGSQQHHHAQNETSRRTAPSVVLPPPPARSSLKKPGSTVSSANPGLSTASSTTVTSNCPSTPQSNRSLTSLKLRMSRFLPGARCVSAPSSVMGSPASSPRTSTSDILPPEKGCAVFNASPGDRGERLTCIYGLYIFKALSPFLVHLRHSFTGGTCNIVHLRSSRSYLHVQPILSH